MSDTTINPSPYIKDESSTPATTSTPMAASAPITKPAPVSRAAPISRSAPIQPSCENCKLLLQRLERVEKRLKKFTDKQHGERVRSKKILKLLENKDMVLSLKEKGISNRKQAALWECSEISIRRLLAGTLTNDNP